MKQIYSFLILLGMSGSVLTASIPSQLTAPLAESSFSTSPLPAAQDAKVQAILSQLSEKYRTAGGIKATFTGSQQGTLWLKADRFYLNCGGVESWFDGKTQWSYVAENEEVTVSTPTPEELQGINPFVLLQAAQSEFEGRYMGNAKVGSRQGEKLQLTPKAKGDITSVTLIVSAEREPLLLAVQLSNGESQEFRISSYQSGQNLPDTAFQFPTAKYPNAEVVDMR